MKIHPPKVTIDEKDPFAHALFGRKQFAESLTALLRNASENPVIFVHAPWGEGKTTFAQMWRAHLRGLKLDTIYYDAYSADYFDDAFVSFSGEILNFVEDRFAEIKGIEKPRREFQKTAVKVGKRLIGLTAKVGVRAATLGAVDATHLKELHDIGSEMATGASDIAADVIKEKIEGYVSQKDALKEFRESLAKLAAVVREEQDFPLTIIVDELDRCRPDFALSLLERIKHLFDVENVAFVLLVNRDQIENYIHTIYGSEVDARAYLLKFGNIFVDLPTESTPSAEEQGRDEYCAALLKHYEISNRAGSSYGSLLLCVQLFAEQFELTLREIERVASLLSIYYGSISDHQSDIFLAAMLGALKIKRPAFYKKLSTSSITVDHFFKETGLGQFKRRDERLNESSRKSMLKYLLMTDEEIQTETEKGQWKDLPRLANYYGNDFYRKRMIPGICNALNRFSLRP